MSTDPYRDELASALAHIARLEEELATRDKVIEELESARDDRDAVFTRLKGVIDDRKEPRSGRWVFLGGLVIGCAGLVAAALSLRHATAAQSPAPAPATANPPASLAPLDGDPCSRLGVRFTLDGEDAEAPATTERDLAGHKYRRDGSRSPWFTVRGGTDEDGGAIYIHGVGNFLPADLGTTELSLLTIVVEGDTEGYALAHNGKSMLEVVGSDTEHIWGRFEADVSKVADTTRPAPFGTPVVRVRGEFCLPALPANPSDTGP
jgi:hypothetical protein